MTARGLVLAALAACFVSLTRAQQRCYVTVDGPARAVVQQPALFAVTVGWDVEWFAAHRVALVRQPTDAPMHLQVPWLRDGDGREVEVMSAPGGALTASIAVGDRVFEALPLEDVTRDGRSFRRVRLTVRLLPLRAGVLTLEPVRARYAYATEFRDHLLRGREPVDRQEASVVSDGLQLDVRRLAGDAPEDYGGAVGDFDVELFSGGEEVAVGQPFEVVLTIYGGVETNLAQVRAPVPSGLDGFHVQGVIETEVEQGRRFTIQLVPLRAGMTAVEGLTFVTYSLKSSSFARLGGEPVPVRVVPRRDGVALPEGIEELIRQDELARGGGGAWLRWVFVGLAAGGLGMFLFGRGRRRREQLVAAMAALRAALDAGDAVASASAFEVLLAKISGGDKFAIKVRKEGGEVAAPSPGFHLAFTASSPSQVDAFFQAAVQAGGRDNGPPGLRPQYGPGYYAAFIIDPDGYPVEAVHHAA